MGAAALLLAVAFTWPLARCGAGRGIVYTAFERGGGGPRAMVPGDHLQFLYHLWLAHDTFAGRTPLFANPYEFNEGDDDERHMVSTYYLPFSAFSAAAAALTGSRAAGWNFAIWMSLWLTGLASWALARRFVASEWAAGALALVPVAFPYAWVNLLSGSPTGFALMWVPLILWGLDRWAADASPAGAAWAGAAVFFSSWCDTHVFFFSVLAAPAWTLFAWWRVAGFRLPTRREWASRLKAAWPLGIFALLTAVQAWTLGHGLKDSSVAAGRSTDEVALFSVPLSGLWREGGLAKTYLGIPALACAALLAVLGLAGLFRRSRRRDAALLLALLAGMGAIAWLASGPAAPGGGLIRRGLVAVIPPYAMIRQADKVFCLMPALAMVACALGFRLLGGKRRWRVGILFVLAVAVGASWARRHTPGICLLDAGQDAYAAVAADAAERATEPHAVALPLWPGDSHISSVYQHDASLYRIRMLNGYRPTVRRPYLERIFLPLESINLGWPSADQLRLLRDCRVGYILFHEDTFPAKAGSFPAGATLANLLRHPRLRFLARDRGVWAFRILEFHEKPETLDSPDAPPVLPNLPVLFPVRTWNWKNGVAPGTPGTEILPGPAASADAWLRVGETAPAVTGRCFRVAGPWAWEWRFRARGRASLEWTTRDDSGPTATRTFDIDAPDWTWYAVPATLPANPDAEPDAAHELSPAFRILSGEADMDAVLLTSRSSFPPAYPGAAIDLPAVAFFRDGCTDPADGSVTFAPEDTPSGEVLHSDHLPLAPGPLRIRLDAGTPAPDGTPLGTLSLRIGSGPTAVAAECPVVAGSPAELALDVPDNRFFRLSFSYVRSAPCTIRGIRFERPAGN